MDLWQILESNKEAIQKNDFRWIMNYATSDIQKSLNLFQDAGVEPFSSAPDFESGPFDAEFLSGCLLDIYTGWSSGEFVAGWSPDNSVSKDELDAYAKVFKALGFKVYRCKTGYWGGYDILIHSPKYSLSDVLEDTNWEDCALEGFIEIK